MSIQLTVMSLDFDSSAAPVTKVYEKNEITLGRLPGNDLVLDKPEVSGYHARLRIAESDPEKPLLFVKDLGSSNGTMVENNSLRAQVEVEVQPNQRIIIGNYLIKPALAPASKFEDAADETEELNADDFDSAATISDRVINFEADEEETTEQLSNGAAHPQSMDIEAEDHAATDPLAAIDELSSPAAESLAAKRDSAITISVAGGDVDIDFTAVELFQIEGTILHNGRPLSGVQVDGGALGDAQSDDSGRFAFKDLPEGSDYNLSFEKEGYTFDFEHGSGTVSGPVGIAVRAVELFDLSGVVRHHGKPLADVIVRAGELGEQRTDSEGRFLFAAVRDATPYTLELEREGFLLDTSSFSGVVNTDLEVLETSARQLFRITGVITHKGKPLVGVTVDGGSQLGTTVTDEEGRYVFENVPEDAEYTLTAKKDDFIFAPSAQ